VIVQQVVHLAATGANSIRVVVDDIDIFVLLLYYYVMKQLTCNIVMTGTIRGRTSVDIKATAEKHGQMIPHLLAAHVILGCDTVAYMWGIGKVKVLKALTAGNHLKC
jgi:hypothetical protein